MQHRSLVIFLSATALLTLSIGKANAELTALKSIKTQEDGSSAYVNLLNASDAASWGPMTFIGFAEGIAYQMMTSQDYPLPQLQKHRSPERAEQTVVDRHRGRTLTEAMRLSMASVLNGGQTAIPCQTSGTYTIDTQGTYLEGGGGAYVLTITYNACRSEDSETQWVSELSGPITIRMLVDNAGNKRVYAVRYGQNYGRADATAYIETAWFSYAPVPPQVIRNMNYEIVGDFIQFSVVDENGGIYYSEDPFSFYYDGIISETSFAVYPPETEPSPVLTEWIAEKMSSQGKFIRRLPDQQNSELDLTHINGTFSYHINDPSWGNGTSRYQYDHLTLSNRSEPGTVSLETSLRDWTIDGTVFVSNPPWRMRCGNGRYRYATVGRLQGFPPQWGQTTVNDNTVISYDNQGAWISINGQPPFSGTLDCLD